MFWTWSFIHYLIAEEIIRQVCIGSYGLPIRIRTLKCRITWLLEISWARMSMISFTLRFDIHIIKQLNSLRILKHT
jgi:hypothetical protein